MKQCDPQCSSCKEIAIDNYCAKQDGPPLNTQLSEDLDKKKCISKYTKIGVLVCQLAELASLVKQGKLVISDEENHYVVKNSNGETFVINK